MKTASSAVILSCLLALALAGCAVGRSGSSYERSAARSEMTVRFGVVESVREVTIEGTKSAVGAAAGAAVGGIAGSHVGDGSVSTVGAILGAVAGGVLGGAIEEHATRKPGLEITIKLDNGEYVAITQEADESFRPGDRVRLLSGRGTTRVTR